ncbi:MAG: type III PLP-dependent enzyme [Roseicyclus sp.]
MHVDRPLFETPQAYLARVAPDEPVLFLSPDALAAAARAFCAGFPGTVTYAVKANPEPDVLHHLAAAGVRGFDVASPAEIALLRATVPGAVLHYNNPVRSRSEIAVARAAGVASYAVDDAGELAKLADLPPGTEIAVRFKLPVAGAAYDFGAKFGAEPEAAEALLAKVREMGMAPALTFNPGTQCTDPAAWTAHIRAAARIARAAGVRIARLNVGGGFPARRMARDAPPLAAIFAAIARATREAFGGEPPALICEPGRALVAEAVSLALRVKSRRPGVAVYLNDGIYGALAEQPLMGMTDRIEALAPDGCLRDGPCAPVTLWGPTCDSLDRIPGSVALPESLAEGDYLLLHGLGAYSTATVTRFNGYGGLKVALVRKLSRAQVGAGHAALVS